MATPAQAVAPLRTQRVSRRGLIGGAAAGALALPAFLRTGRAFAQESGTGFDREATITSWGFGAEETNPMAYSRIEAFRQAYPSITLELVPEVDDQKILTGYASDQLPDLLWLDRFAITSWASRGVLAPLEEFIEQDGYDTSRFYETALDEVRFEDQHYGIPQFMDVRALYVNNAALTEVGADAAQLDTGNWESLSELGARLVQRDGDQVNRWGFDHKLQAEGIWVWGFGNGGQFFDPDGEEVTYDDPKVVEALQWGIDAYEAQGGFRLYEAVATTWQGDEQFARGQVAMTMYENWMLGIVARVAPDLDFQVLPVKVRGGQDMVSQTGGRAWCIPSTAKDSEAAWEFIKFMTAPETWKIGAEAVKSTQQQNNAPYIPTLTADKNADQMQITEVYQSIDPKFDEAVRLFPQILEFSYNRPIGKSAAGNQLRDILQQDGVLPALRGEKPAQEAMQTADQNAQEAIESL